MKLKRKLFKINFNPSSKGDYVAPDGEVESCVVSDSWLSPDPLRGFGLGADEEPDEEEPDTPALLAPAYTLPPGLRLLCLHSGCSFHPDTHLIMQDADGALFSASSASSNSSYNPQRIASDNLFPDFSKGVSLGDHVALLSSSGLYFLSADSDGDYRISPPGMDNPVVEFALIRRPLPGFSLLPGEWPHGEITVDTSADNPTYHARLAASVEKFRREIEKGSEDASLFTAPFLIMTGLRLTDGSLLPISSPILMIPNSENPTLKVESTAENTDNVRHTVSWYGRVCRLDMRILTLPETFRHAASYVSALEILATDQVELRHDCRETGVGIRTVAPAGYSDSMEESGTTRLPTADSGVKVRGFTGDSRSRGDIESDILRLAEFHTIAAIPFDEIKISDTFTPVPIIPGRISADTSLTKIIPDFGSMTSIAPGGIAEANSRLVAWGGRALPPLPSPLRGTAPCRGRDTEPKEGYWNVGLEVTLLKEGIEVTTPLVTGNNPTILTPYSASDIPGSLPCWIFYPDPDACRVRITAVRGNESRCYTFPMHPHPSLHGTVWFQGLNPEINTESQEPTAIPGSITTSYPLPHSVFISPERMPLIFPSSGRVRAGENIVAGVVATVRSLSSGRLGEFPFHILTDKGVWAVATTDYGFRTVQPISLYGCISPESVAVTPHGTLFATDAGPIVLDGTKTTLLPRPAVGDYRLFYLPQNDSALLFIPGEEGSFHYSFSKKKWYPSAKTFSYVISGGVVSPSGAVFTSASRLRQGTRLPGFTDGGTGEEEAEEQGWLVTLRPLKLITPHTMQKVWGVTCGGENISGLRLRLWGAMRPGIWYPVAEGEGELRCMAGSGARYWRLQILFRAKSPRNLQFAIFTVRDS